MPAPITIDRIRILEIDLPLRIPFQISGGTMNSRRSLIVELHSGGAVGYGESAPFEFPFYSAETFGSALALFDDLLITRIKGKSFASVQELDTALRQGVRGNPFARCGFENAFWDLLSATSGKTLQDLILEELQQLGVPDVYCKAGDRIASGVAIGIPEKEDLGTLKSWLEQYRSEGYRRVKIKIRPGWDVEPCRVARETLGSDFLLWADANASFSLDKHKDVLKRLDEFRMAFIEQPLHHDDIMDHSQLAAMIDTPVCLDESLKTVQVARQAVRFQSARVWNIKVQRMGGLLEAIKTYAVAVENNIELWGGTMPESGIGAQSIMALASFDGFVYPADVEPSSRWYASGTDPLPIEMSPEGWISVPPVAGLSALINPEIYKARAKVLRE